MPIPSRRALMTALAILPFARGAFAGEADAALKTAIAGPWRNDANRARDVYRHPAEALAFWGLKPGMSVLEIDPGGKGWWVEILAPYAKATGGKYTAAMRNPQDENFWKEVADKSVYGDVATATLTPEGNDLKPASADFILVARAFHNWAQREGLTASYLKTFYDTLKPGGILAVEQHRAPEGSDPKAGNGYVPESYVIGAAEAVGFKLAGKSEINANPKDTRDHPFGVWTLPPVRKSSEGEKTLTDAERAHFDGIGESDRMTLKFVKA